MVSGRRRNLIEKEKAWRAERWVIEAVHLFDRIEIGCRRLRLNGDTPTANPRYPFKSIFYTQQRRFLWRFIMPECNESTLQYWRSKISLTEIFHISGNSYLNWVSWWFGRMYFARARFITTPIEQSVFQKYSPKFQSKVQKPYEHRISVLGTVDFFWYSFDLLYFSIRFLEWTRME